MKDFSFVTGPSSSFIESLYNDYEKNPDVVDPEWKNFFDGFDFAVGRVNGSAADGKTTVDAARLEKEFSVFRLIRAYRKRGHLLATTNPIRPRKDRKPFLDLKDFGLSDADLDTSFAAGKFIGLENKPLKEILAKLKQTYTSDVGIEYTYITDKDRCAWVEKEFEAIQNRPVPIEEKKRILEKLNEGVIFEKFLHTKYIGQKRFSLEGGESTIPALDKIISDAAGAGVKEVVIGMAHRGRLNVLANILGKTYEQIFSEFEGNVPPETMMGSGDVKYHLGFHACIKTPEGKEVNVQLAPNPSHLEIVGPVVSGFARSKADVLYNYEYDKVLPIIIHGDAAIAGQGVVYELLQMSRLEGYNVGGTIHFVINNQIGFTTDFDDARSADYCTSVAAMVQAPVLHVNGDDPQAVVKAAALAVKYRQEYNQDIFIDMVCYRRHGHNEGDDPSFTQPLMYERIKQHPNVREVYNQKLMALGDVQAALVKEMEDKFWKNLQDRLDEIRQKPLPYQLQAPEKAWKNMEHATAESFNQSPETGVSRQGLDRLMETITSTPEGFDPVRKIRKLLEEKHKLYTNEGLVDWSTAELLSYASIVADQKDVRLSGQDVERGTFSHRHSVLHDEETGKTYNRLSNIPGEGVFHVYNSLLSEFAVLAFEYGYSIANPNVLTIWEAQFGDFANGAQSVIDQYISSAETKWNKSSGLVLLLPHGYEGQGPEHSSARLERFLQLCAEDNLVITNITTAANFFHAMRRQLTWNFRKPLVNFSPKANLRLNRSYSRIEELVEGRFQEVIDDPSIQTASKVKRVVLCTGKLYYDLSERQAEEKRSDVAIVRLEQVYPTPINQLRELRKKYKNAEWVWAQEEPRNMGALGFLKLNLPDDFPMAKYISRPTAAAPATGFSKVHGKEQKRIVDEALTVA